jgi:hypothetical protein
MSSIMKHKKIRPCVNLSYANLSYASDCAVYTRTCHIREGIHCPELVRWIKGSRLWCIADGTLTSRGP